MSKSSDWRDSDRIPSSQEQMLLLHLWWIALNSHLYTNENRQERGEKATMCSEEKESEGW